MTENALLPSDYLTCGMERTCELEDLVETECVTEMKDYCKDI